MKKSKLKKLQLAGFVVASIGGLWASTQLFAAELGYHKALGEPLVHASNYAIYAPWQWFIWASDYYEHTPTLFDDTMLGAAGGLFVGLLWMVALKKRFGPKDQPTSHGSSRWATSEELEETGLPNLPEEARGVVLGLDEQGRYLTHDGKEHAFCFAPTRAGKGVGLVIPTLLTWRHSVVVLDVKGENWEITAPWRSQFSHCLYFNPADDRSVHFNPLLEVRKGPKEVRDVRNIVEIICDPDGDSQGSDFWTDSAKSLLTAAILHVLYAENDKSLAGVLSFLRDPERSTEETLERMKKTPHKHGKPHPIVAQSAQSMLNMAEKARSGVVSTAERFLNLFEDPILAEVTSRSDFRLRDLQQAGHPVSLYLVVPPSDMTRLRPVLRLMLIQMGSALTEELDEDSRKHKLLMLLDEFPTLGRLDWFESALAYVAGYDIKCYLIAQDLNQIEKAYGANNAILGNCHLRVTFAPNDERTAKRISDLLGTATATKKTESLSGKRGSFSLENKSESEVEYARELMTPGEVMQLPPDESIVLVAGQYPIRAKKVRYYQDPHFQRYCPQWNAKFQPLELGGVGYPDVPGGVTDDWTGLKVEAASASSAEPSPPPESAKPASQSTQPAISAPEPSESTPAPTSPPGPAESKPIIDEPELGPPEAAATDVESSPASGACTDDGSEESPAPSSGPLDPLAALMSASNDEAPTPPASQESIASPPDENDVSEESPVPSEDAEKPEKDDDADEAAEWLL